MRGGECVLRSSDRGQRAPPSLMRSRPTRSNSARTGRTCRSMAMPSPSDSRTRYVVSFSTMSSFLPRSIFVAWFRSTSVSTTQRGRINLSDNSSRYQDHQRPKGPSERSLCSPVFIITISGQRDSPTIEFLANTRSASRDIDAVRVACLRRVGAPNILRCAVVSVQPGRTPVERFTRTVAGARA